MAEQKSFIVHGMGYKAEVVRIKLTCMGNGSKKNRQAKRKKRSVGPPYLRFG